MQTLAIIGASGHCEDASAALQRIVGISNSGGGRRGVM
jgi:hypothetical protein